MKIETKPNTTPAADGGQTPDRGGENPTPTPVWFVQFVERLREVLKLCASYPDLVELKMERGGRYPLLRLSACPADLRRFIGEQGRCRRALLYLVHCASALAGCDALVERFVETPGPTTFSPFRPNPNWPADRIKQAFAGILNSCTGDAVEVIQYDDDDSTTLVFECLTARGGGWYEGLDTAIRVIAAVVGRNNGRVLRGEVRCRRTREPS